jgi:glutamyl-tRNA reductase
MNKECRVIEDLSRGIVNKLFHGPMQHLDSHEEPKLWVQLRLDLLY